MRSLWRTVQLGYRAEPGLLVASFAMTLFAALPDGLIALWLASSQPASATTAAP